MTKPNSKFNFDTFCQRMTCHGLGEFNQSHNVIGKSFWAFLMICAIGFLVYQGYSEVCEFLHNPIITSLSVETLQMMAFPLVYICPSNFVNWEYVDRCGNHTEFVDRASIILNNYGLESHGSVWESVVNSISHGHHSAGFKPDCGASPINETDEQYIKRNSLWKSMFIRQCAFQGIVLDCLALTEEILDKEYGVCYLINISSNNTPRYQLNPGKGLSLVLDIQTELFNPDAAAMRQPVYDGIHVQIADSHDPADFTGLLIQPGTVARVALRKTVKTLIVSPPFSKTPQVCVEPRHHNWIMVSNVSYSQQMCVSDCVLRIIFTACQCVMPMDSRYFKSEFKGRRLCRFDDYHHCIATALAEDKKHHLESNNCTYKCFASCHQSVIEMIPSFASFPSETLLNKAEEENLQSAFGSPFGPPPDTFEGKGDESSKYAPKFMGSVKLKEVGRWSKNLILLEISFDQFEIIHFEQSPSRTITSLLSNVGGQAGLWTGASIFTFVQLFVFGCLWLQSKRQVRSTITINAF